MNKKIVKKIIFLSGFFLIILCLVFSLMDNTSYSFKYENFKKDQSMLIIAHKDIFKMMQRPQVIFPHSRHISALKKEGCEVCHTYNKEGYYDFSFILNMQNRTAEETEDLFHKRCINCHRERMKEYKKYLPVRCGDCHIKKLNSLISKYPICEFDFSLHNKHINVLKDKVKIESCIFCHHSYDVLEKDENLRLIYEAGTEGSCYYCHGILEGREGELKPIRDISEFKNLTTRKIMHKRCINCHLFYLKLESKKAGPYECKECHTGNYKTVNDLFNIPRPDRDQPRNVFLVQEDSKMKGVLFNHLIHENNVKTCKKCHHETLNACRKCHQVKRKEKGLNNIYHSIDSERSCLGCHKKRKEEDICIGCHQFLPDIDLQSKEPKKEFCVICHSGKKENIITYNSKYTITALKEHDIPDKVTIKVLENFYEPSTLPHLKIIEKLLSNTKDSKLSILFHKDVKTICKGCHHQSNDSAELKKDKPPYCRNCHNLSFEEKNINRPRLIAAYHRQCINCHIKMKIEKALKCDDCHKSKEVLSETIDILNFER